MSKRITVIGAGPGGYVAAIRAAQLGAEVTVIEQEAVGGTCLNWGCIPSKVMKTTAEMLEKFRRAQEFGIELHGTVSPDMNALMARKQKVIRDQTEGVLKLLKHHKISYLAGRATIEGPNRVVARLLDGRRIEVRWDRLILGTGSEQVSIPAFPFDGQRILSTNDALCLEEVPESVLILGGGVIGCEFAFILTALGAQVTIVEALSRILPLPWIDEDSSKVLEREMKKRKITFMLNRTVSCVDMGDEKCRVTIGPYSAEQGPEHQPVKPTVVEVDKVLICVGRRPVTEGIGLEELGVKLDESGWIVAGERMETSASGVYAIGDVLGPSKIMLAHVASTEGIVAAENAMGRHKNMNYEVVPGAAFTMPEVANVGLTEAQAKESGCHVRSDRVLFRNLGKLHVIGEIAGHAKIVSDRESGRVLGVHIVGPHASDLIAEAALGMKLGCTVKQLADTMHAHPTLPEIMLEASFKALDRPLHG
ncbi:MAG: dihydrolipoyl dehydrogenase [Deltaproteobacteria bacterium]|nr:MAG: dihydrolipoyl dehydrogenase [Deltaproteobacteria bacterium]